LVVKSQGIPDIKNEVSVGNVPASRDVPFFCDESISGGVEFHSPPTKECQISLGNECSIAPTELGVADTYFGGEVPFKNFGAIAVEYLQGIVTGNLVRASAV